METAGEALARLTSAAHHRSITDDEYERRALELQDQIAAMTDKELVAEYQKTDGTPAIRGLRR